MDTICIQYLPILPLYDCIYGYKMANANLCFDKYRTKMKYMYHASLYFLIFAGLHTVMDTF